MSSPHLRPLRSRPPRPRPLRLGTRGSPLALAQAAWVARQLRQHCGRVAVLVTVATPGDESTAPVERLGTTGYSPLLCARRCCAARSTSSSTPPRTCRQHGYRDCR